MSLKFEDEPTVQDIREENEKIKAELEKQKEKNSSIEDKMKQLESSLKELIQKSESLEKIETIENNNSDETDPKQTVEENEKLSAEENEKIRFLTIQAEKNLRISIMIFLPLVIAALPLYLIGMIKIPGTITSPLFANIKELVHIKANTDIQLLGVFVGTIAIVIVLAIAFNKVYDHILNKLQKSLMNEFKMIEMRTLVCKCIITLLAMPFVTILLNSLKNISIISEVTVFNFIDTVTIEIVVLNVVMTHHFASDKPKKSKK